MSEVSQYTQRSMKAGDRVTFFHGVQKLVGTIGQSKPVMQQNGVATVEVNVDSHPPQTVVVPLQQLEPYKPAGKGFFQRRHR